MDVEPFPRFHARRRQVVSAVEAQQGVHGGADDVRLVIPGRRRQLEDARRVPAVHGHLQDD